MLIVQRIRTEWTKASRGGDDAARRNATPEAFLLPPISDAGADYLFHDNRFLERERFQHRSTFAESRVQPHLRVEPLFLHVTPDSVATRFVWSWHHCGAPERESHDLFNLSLGEWGRFCVNGRFGAESATGREWGYHKTVFNIAFVAKFTAGLFIQSTPTASDSRLAALK